jgi:hypothetical protein
MKNEVVPARHAAEAPLSLKKKYHQDIGAGQWLHAVFIALLFMLWSPGFAAEPPATRNALLRDLIRLNDEGVPALMESQLMAKGKLYFGAAFDADSVVSPIRTAGLIQSFMCAYTSRDSKYYRSAEVLNRMTLAAQALVNLQHDDGTIDLLTTNFHSTPDLGFTVYPLALAYSIALKNKDANFGEFMPLLKKYLLKAGNALSVGGIHTPNHRWVVSGALAWLYSFFPNPAYSHRVDQWLAEKIDIDPDGQYHERSTSVYTPVTNRSLLFIAQKLNHEALYEAVRKNLDMTFYLVHSNGEIATESSRRQDKYVRSDMGGYYLAYNFMALHDKDSRYSGMVDYIMQTVPAVHLLYMLPLFLDDPTLLGELPNPVPVPTRYHKEFNYSDMVRVREGNVDMSIISDNTTFFTFFKGQAALEGVRLSSAFFGKGQFQSERMEKDGDTYILSSVLEGPYYQPLPPDKIPKEGDAWNQVPRTERAKSEVQVLRTKVSITPKGKMATISVVVDGPENLPVTLELAFRTGGTLKNVVPKRGVAQAYLGTNGGYTVYEREDDQIRVGPGVLAHKWTQLRGALPKLEADCVYFTAYAPCEFTFTID